jgi:ADP-ribosylglycohydrolase
MSAPRSVSLDRCRGALLGLAGGDALGATLEFRPPDSFEPITDMIGGGPFSLAPGQCIDDTSMALCLAERLVECGGFDASDQLRRYVRWWRTGRLSCTGACFDRKLRPSYDVGVFPQMSGNRSRAGGGDPVSCCSEHRAGGGHVAACVPPGSAVGVLTRAGTAAAS